MKNELIKEAIQQYSVHGYYGATMRKIATNVGIRPASIYYFYENKEKLFIAAFQQLLNDHFKNLKKILSQNKDSEVEEIFSALLHGNVEHHLDDLQSTNAYISLVTSPIPEIKSYLSNHMLRINDWLNESLKSALIGSYPMMTEAETDKVIKQWVLIANGVFWGIKLYEGRDFTEQVELADQMILTLFHDLERKYGRIRDEKLTEYSE